MDAELHRVLFLHMTPSPNHRDHTQEEERIGDVLVIGDDSVSSSIVRYLTHTVTVIFLERDIPFPTRVEEHARKVIEVSGAHELIKEIDTTPGSAIVATSQDGRNLLFVQHLLLEFDMVGIVVRVNNPQNINAYDDLPVAVVDATDLVGSALAQQLRRSSSSQ